MNYDSMVRMAVKRAMYFRYLSATEGKIEVVLKETGRRVWVSPKTVKENPSKYDKAPKTEDSSEGGEGNGDAKSKNPPKSFFNKLKEKARSLVDKASTEARKTYENATREIAQGVLTAVSKVKGEGDWEDVTPQDFSKIAFQAMKASAVTGAAVAAIASYKFLEPELTARYGEVVYTMMRKGRLTDVKSWQMALSLSAIFSAPTGAAAGFVGAFGPARLFETMGDSLIDKAKTKKSSRLIIGSDLTVKDQKNLIEFYATITATDYELLDFLHSRLKPAQWEDDKAFEDALSEYAVKMVK